MFPELIALRRSKPTHASQPYGNRPDGPHRSGAGHRSSPPILGRGATDHASFSVSGTCMDVAGARRNPLPSDLLQARTNESTPDPKKAQEACVICLEPISERAVAVPCNHCSFDFICAASWLQECSQCPLCKAEVTVLEYDWRSPEDFKRFHVQTTATPPSPAPRNSYRNRNLPPRRLRRHYNGIHQVEPNTALLQRRYVYRHNLYSLHVGSNRVSQFRNFTPHDFASSPILQSRARQWVRRELQVFDFLHPTSNISPSSSSSDRRASNAEFLLEYIIAILKSVDIKGCSGQAEDMLADFLGRENARLFLHELEAWLRSPYTSLEDYDRHVQYLEKLPVRFDMESSPRSTFDESYHRK